MKWGAMLKQNDIVRVIATGKTATVTVVGVDDSCDCCPSHGSRQDMVEVLIDGIYHLFGPEQLELAE